MPDRPSTALVARVGQQLALAQQELVRIQTDAADKTAQQQARIVALGAVQNALTPDLLTLIDTLAQVGITLTVSG